MVICSQAQMGVTMGKVKVSKILQMSKLSNHWMVNLQIKFAGNALACRSVMLWSFAHQGHMGMPTGVLRPFGILQILELSNHWADSPHSRPMEVSWPVDIQRYGRLPIEATLAFPRA